MRIASLVLLFGMTTLIAAGADVNVKVVPVKSTPVSSGRDMFAAYCASCHGVDGKGNGVAAPALKVHPADLTTLALRNGGKFPGLDVTQAIQNGAVIAHGTPEMPVWGPILQSISNGPIIVHHRIANITAYIESLQTK